jgi:hypothetical protein
MSRDGGECTTGGMNVPHFAQLISDSGAVTTGFWIAPCNNRASFQDRSKIWTVVFFSSSSLSLFGAGSHRTLQDRKE